MEKSADAFRTISEVADDLILPQHVLRFWETRFPQIRPLKRAGGRRYYRPADVVLLKTIRQLLYDDGYTIKGVQRLLKEQGPRGLGAVVPFVAAGSDAPAVSDATAGFDALLAEDENEMHLGPERPAADALFVAVPDQAPAGLPLGQAGMSAAQRDAIDEALATIDECLGILAAAARRAS